ncbi:MAG: 50S ribosomal protein L24 [Candidatus Lokiarchaeota archaeon]|jgi:large subunit ribosomal protein L24|nr:50S ribosomal protein L24 [Candidatus Lokiarchaeota archaeon]MBD3200760.1 50S ribosomal protein L24 [Candidatus Lokiarchaeota archaeon]
MKVTSKKPRKQRKALYNYKNHQRSKLLRARVADFLQEDYGIKTLPLRVGDSVRIIAGEFKDFEGEVIEVTKNLRVKIKEAAFEKADGTEFNPSIHISKVIITKLKDEKKMDPWRVHMIDRKSVFGFDWQEELKGPKKELEEEVEEE